ncbi:hypothetical protein OUZ56_028607 [Daphnia magna]|uniref:Uncharacterized protein n=1 Tax=Daphnia magna TaxID=35525 RepID=A0ABR0B4Z0_9CRUS|nr:hypothetical protein OUZ56_028607 [Daphnia magna]
MVTPVGLRVTDTVRRRKEKKPIIRRGRLPIEKGTHEMRERENEQEFSSGRNRFRGRLRRCSKKKLQSCGKIALAIQASVSATRIRDYLSRGVAANINRPIRHVLLCI